MVRCLSVAGPMSDDAAPDVALRLKPLNFEVRQC
jgi:hypothetical protein